MDHPLIREVLSLRLPADDFLVAGSGPLLALGIRDDIGDVDVVARDKAWSRALSLGTPGPAVFGGGVERVQLLDGRIEILNEWFPEIWSVDDLIERSSVVDGVRYASLEDVYHWKRKLDRPKDRKDVILIERYAREGRRPPCGPVTGGPSPSA
ncbi:hypothetical protein [Streptosporangium sp. NPDC048865]|uniref:hypothetical protein n=1 Tax=Streptosporangium sp. NPDC048865 TaxID=3155766 RepID=UPI003445CFCE